MLRQRRRLLMQSNKSILPPEYVQLEYIKSTGTQYLSLGFLGTAQIKVEIDCKPTATSGATQYICGSVSSNTNKMAFVVDGAQVKCTTGRDSVTATDSTADDRRYYIFGGGEFTEKSRTTPYGNIRFSSQTYQFLLFNASPAGSYSGATVAVYYCKIYRSNNVIRELIPCRRIADGAAGMYDTINGYFYINSAAGDFIHGPVVN